MGGSNSKNSINRSLAYFAAELFEVETIVKYDVSQIELPIYSIDNENESGIPVEVLIFAQQIDEADLMVLSLAENNGSFNVGFKNLMDWTSRMKDRKTFNGTPIFLMATSPGPRGGATVLSSAESLFPYSGAEIVGTFLLPNFYQNFDFEKGIVQEELLNELKSSISKIKARLQ